MLETATRVLLHWTALVVYALVLAGGAALVAGQAQQLRDGEALLAAGTTCDGGGTGDCLVEEYGSAHGRWERPDSTIVRWTFEGHQINLRQDDSEVLEDRPGAVTGLFFDGLLVGLRTSDGTTLPAAKVGGGGVAFRLSMAVALLGLAAAFARVGLARGRLDGLRVLRTFLMGLAVVIGAVVAAIPIQVGLPWWLGPLLGGVASGVAALRMWRFASPAVRVGA